MNGHQEYPKMLYRSETEHRVVQDEHEEERARGEGFGDYAELMAEPQATDTPPAGDDGEPKPEVEPQATDEPAPDTEAPKKRR